MGVCAFPKREGPYEAGEGGPGVGWGGQGAQEVGPVQMEGQDGHGFMFPEWDQAPVLGGECFCSCPLGCFCARVVLYQGGAPSPPTCCSTAGFPCRSEFTDTILSVHPSDVLDMPVDPNEPTYCLCHQVSYGEMIGCDNPDVSVGRLWAGPCTRGGGVGVGHRSRAGRGSWALGTRLGRGPAPTVAGWGGGHWVHV